MLALETDDAGVEVRVDAAYPYAQVWVPPGRPFAALEPMTVPTNALAAATRSRWCGRATTFSASFAVVLR